MYKEGAIRPLFLAVINSKGQSMSPMYMSLPVAPITRYQSSPSYEMMNFIVWNDV